MNKIAYIIDSACFLSEEKAKEMGFHFLPLHCIVEEEDFLEGKNLDNEFLMDAIKNKKNVTTSQPSPGEVIELINKLKQEGYTCGIFSSIGSGLSKTSENVVTTSKLENFPMYLIDSASVGMAQFLPLQKVKNYIEDDDYTIEDAIEAVQKDIQSSNTILMVDDLYHLSRGGRITPSAAAFGSMLKIKPLLSLIIEDKGKIDVIGKVRTSKKATMKMAKLILKNYDMENHRILVADFYGDELAAEVKKELLKINPKLEIEEFKLTTVIGVHTGLNSVGIQICLK